jgi:predicted kinase
MVGLPCSGKTTYARQLAGEINALLLTLDVWHLKLFGHDVGHEHRNLPEGAFEIPKAEMDRYITIFQPLTGDKLV